VLIDGEFWGTITSWKDRYDTAIGNQLRKEDAAGALGAL